MDEIKPFTDRIKRLQEANDTLCEQLADQNVLRFHIKELEKQLAESKAAGRQATEHLLLADRGRREAEAAGAVLVEILKGEESHELDCAVYLETGPDCTCELQPANSYIRDAINNLPASVRRHVAVDTALEEVAANAVCDVCESRVVHPGGIDAGRPYPCDAPFHAALAKLDAARRGEGPSNG